MEPAIDPRLIGFWRVTSREEARMEGTGFVIGASLGQRVEFTERGRYTIHVTDDRWPLHYGCRTDASAEPHAIRFFMTSTGSYTYGIYRFEGEELVVWVSVSGRAAPKGFDDGPEPYERFRYHRAEPVRRAKRRRRPPRARTEGGIRSKSE
jgi:hypothetical protein